MIGPNGTIPARLVRRVEKGTDGSVTVADLTGQPVFRVELVRPRLGVDLDVSPRLHAGWTVRWRTGLWGPQGYVPSGSSRIEVDGAAYELLGSPKTLMHGRRAVGYEATAHPVNELYPYIGDLTEQNGTVVSASMRFSMWSPNEFHSQTGEYEDYQAEAPPEYRDLIKRNRQIHMGGKTYRIMVVTTELTVPHVVFRLRRAGG